MSSTTLTERLNQILPTIISDQFLSATGVGNEIPYHVFEYPAEEELRVREHIEFLLQRIPMQKPGIRLVGINLFDFMIEYLKKRGVLEKAFEMEKTQGQQQLHKKLETLLEPEKISPLLAEQMQPDQTDLVLIHGVGSVWPFMRASGVLNSLHKHTGRTPVVMFYPGTYDQVSFRLFGKVRDKDKQDNYYRAFRLIP
jgi:hypothetical protein